MKSSSMGRQKINEKGMLVFVLLGRNGENDTKIMFSMFLSIIR